MILYILKLADFGHSFYLSNLNKSRFTGTYPYREPESMLEIPQSIGSDIWSIGCVIGEMVLRNKLFHENKNKNQNGGFNLHYINSILGPMTEENWPNITSNLYYKKYSCHMNKKTIDLKILLKGFDGNAINDNGFDLISKCFEYDPEKRISAANALKQPYLQN